MKSSHLSGQENSGPVTSSRFPPLPRGRMRFVLPLLLIAPMPLLSIAETGWQRMLHGREMRAILDMVGSVPVGSSQRWSAPSLLPWGERIGGLLAVERQDGSTGLVCRAVTFSVGEDSPSFFKALLCQTKAQDQWTLVQEGTSRWGG